MAGLLTPLRIRHSKHLRGRLHLQMKLEMLKTLESRSLSCRREVQMRLRPRPRMLRQVSQAMNKPRMLITRTRKCHKMLKLRLRVSESTWEELRASLYFRNW
mmetsp:Transcript_45381/g.115256  ORF Transcript_45381/g.115256 Transcript_45381/m.115256 type:complete len:102 (+) Transcript_45381:257-562(+)